MSLTLPRETLSWNEYFMNLCVDVSKRSKDPSTQHGAILVDENHVVISTGYNGGCRKIPDHLLDWKRPDKYRWVIHAEENALWFSNKRDLNNCTIYVTGPPCSKCMFRLAHLGVSNVVFGQQKSHCVDEDDWKESCFIAKLANINLTNFE